VQSTIEDPDRVRTYPEGQQHSERLDGCQVVNSVACAIIVELMGRLKGTRAFPSWPEHGFLRIGDVHYNASADIWFIEAWKHGNGAPEHERGYLEITQDEAAAWLESHGYSLPATLRPALRLDHGFLKIRDGNTTSVGQPPADKSTPAENSTNRLTTRQMEFLQAAYTLRCFDRIKRSSCSNIGKKVDPNCGKHAFKTLAVELKNLEYLDSTSDEGRNSGYWLTAKGKQAVEAKKR
jgi:hypothetical protein